MTDRNHPSTHSHEKLMLGGSGVSEGRHCLHYRRRRRRHCHRRQDHNDPQYQILLHFICVILFTTTIQTFITTPIEAFVIPSSSSVSSPYHTTNNAAFTTVTTATRSRKAYHHVDRSTLTPLHASNNGSNNNNNADDDNDDPVAFARRMALVRSLQMSYYTTGTSFMDDPKQAVCRLEPSTGKLHNLPLWRAPWYEVPGRSNVLNVHDPVYTNMFESILYKPQPWCFGHLYLEGGSKNLFRGENLQRNSSNHNNSNGGSNNANAKQNKTNNNKNSGNSNNNNNNNKNGPSNGGDVDDDTTLAYDSVTNKESAEGDHKYRLRTWRGGSSTLIRDDTDDYLSSSSAVVGCLMHIADYRRMADGRLLLLVHAMERFVVTDIQQRLPYSVVDAQILPDVEEVDRYSNIAGVGYEGSDDPSSILLSSAEVDMASARAMAVRESVRFHSYEYDQAHSLQHIRPSRRTQQRDIDGRGELQVSDISHAAIAKVLPYTPFSKTVEPPQSRSLEQYEQLQQQEQQESKPTCVDDEELSSSASTSSSSSKTKPTPATNIITVANPHAPSLERSLLHKGVYQIPPSDPDYNFATATNDELEYELWLALNHFLITTRRPVSPILLSLLPPDQTWPDDFRLDKVATEINELQTLDHDYIPVTADYPAYRRQRRVSFSAAYLLEQAPTLPPSPGAGTHAEGDTRETKSFDRAQSLRALLLSIPSTRQRLRVVLEKFLQWQQNQWGSFQ